MSKLSGEGFPARGEGAAPGPSWSDPAGSWGRGRWRRDVGEAFYALAVVGPSALAFFLTLAMTAWALSRVLR